MELDDETLLLMVKEGSIKMHSQIIRKSKDPQVKTQFIENLKSFFKFGEK